MLLQQIKKIKIKKFSTLEVHIQQNMATRAGIIHHYCKTFQVHFAYCMQPHTNYFKSVLCCTGDNFLIWNSIPKEIKESKSPSSFWTKITAVLCCKYIHLLMLCTRALFVLQTTITVHQ